MPSIGERNAGFDALEVFINHMIDQFVPFMFKDRAHAYIASPQGRQAALEGATAVLVAGEKERAKEAKQSGA